MEILFVCSGNTCRSAMAEALLREFVAEVGIDDVEAISAGVYAQTGDPASFGAVAAMDEMGADLHLHRSTRLNGGHIAAADLILCMSRAQMQTIRMLYPQAEEKTRLLLSFAANLEQDISDPFGGDEEVYAACARQIALAVAAVLMRLRPDKADDIRRAAEGEQNCPQ